MLQSSFLEGWRYSKHQCSSSALRHTWLGTWGWGAGGWGDSHSLARSTYNCLVPFLWNALRLEKQMTVFPRAQCHWLLCLFPGPLPTARPLLGLTCCADPAAAFCGLLPPATSISHLVLSNFAPFSLLSLCTEDQNRPHLQSDKSFFFCFAWGNPKHKS